MSVVQQLPFQNGRRPAAIPSDLIWRLSLDQYHDMIRTGILTDDDPVELLEGWLVAKMVKKPPHRVVTGLTRLAMTSRAIRNRHKAAGTGNEIDRLYMELLQRFYEEEDRGRALKVAERLDRLLSRRPEVASSIRGEETRSLVAELRGDLKEAIRCRESEIRKIFQLHDLARNSPSEEYAYRQYDYSDLSDRLDLLAMLFHDDGDLDRAIETLRESKRLCEAHQVPFDGQDLLEEYEEASRTAPARE